MRHLPPGVAAALALIALPLSQARAEDPLGFYLGAAVGQSRAEADASTYYTVDPVAPSYLR